MCGRFAITTARFTRIEGTPRHDVPGGPPPLQHLSIPDHLGHPRIRRGDPRDGRDGLGARPALVEGAEGPPTIGMTISQGPDPTRPVRPRPCGYVEHYQFRFPVAVAVDPDWQTLKRWWLDGHDFRIMGARFEALLAEDP